MPASTCHAILKVAGLKEMEEHVALLRETGLPVPLPNVNPSILIKNEAGLPVSV